MKKKMVAVTLEDYVAPETILLYNYAAILAQSVLKEFTAIQAQ